VTFAQRLRIGPFLILGTSAWQIAGADAASWCGALEVIRHHRLLEAWLVHSQDFERRIAAALGQPERDPNGAPIPRPELVMPEDTVVF
jgi:hypothetical protein